MSTPLPQEDWKAAWDLFFTELRARRERLLRQTAAAWEDLNAIGQQLRQSYSQLQGTAPGATSIPDYQTSIAPAEQALCLGIVEEYLRKRPGSRALEAAQEYDTGLEELSQLLPESVALSGRDFTQAAELVKGPDRSRPPDPPAVPLPLRIIARDLLVRDALERSDVDGGLQRLLGQAAIALRVPWQKFLLREEDPSLAHWSKTWDEFQEEAHAVSESYAAWARRQDHALARAIHLQQLASAKARSHRKKVREARTEFWSRQDRAVCALLAGSVQWRQFMAAAASSTCGLEQSLLREQTDLETLRAATIAWVDSVTLAPDAAAPPKIEARIASVEERAAAWEAGLLESAERILPPAIEAVRIRKRPGPLARWREVRPLDSVRRAVAGSGLPAIQDALAPASAAHVASSADVVKAQNAAEYGRQASLGEQDPRYFEEALSNARSLLQDGSPSHIYSGVAPHLLKAFVAFERACVTDFELAWDGFTPRLSRHRSAEASQLLQRRVKLVGRSGLRDLGRRAKSLRLWLLEILGIALPSRTLVPPLETRPHLTDVLPLHGAGPALPAIYRRLFSLDPVSEERYLVGRETELDGFRHALNAWQRGEPSSTLVVGARGSGKTSLLNCACNSLLAPFPLTRSEFSARLETAAGMDDFLERLPASDGPGQRIIVLEEFERTFLLTPEGLHAVERLLDHIHSAAPSTLWIFSLNNDAMRFLEAALQLGKYFPNRINAMSTTPAGLRNAILQRHNLSGLRLRFAPPPAEDPRVSRVRRWAGLEADPEELFFESLYDQSQGVFRSAFELWQASIERVEGGFVEMRQPLSAQYAPLHSALSQLDHFTLMAILQHGSLLAEELARVLQEPLAQSTLRLRQLQSLGLLEQDPRYPGLRVRPEASRFVRETLHRVNLLS